MRKEFPELLGQVMLSVTINDRKDEMTFKRIDGKSFQFYHSQECCESVSIEDVDGDLNDLVGEPLTVAEEASSKSNDNVIDNRRSGDSETWTFYRFATSKGWVNVRWYGTSNGYYSESVNFKILR